MLDQHACCYALYIDIYALDGFALNLSLARPIIVHQFMLVVIILFHNIGFLSFHHLKLYISPSMVGILTEQMIYPNTHHIYDYMFALIVIHLKEKSWYLCLHSEY